MLLQFLYVFLTILSAVFSAVVKPIDHFGKFHDDAFIQFQFLDHLGCKEKISFMLTCKRFYKYLEIEYNKLFKALYGASYLESDDDALKRDIRRLWKYLIIETQCQGISAQCSLGDFYRMINGSFFTNPTIADYIKKDNMANYVSIYGKYRENRIQEPDRPHFPQLSLLFLSSDHSLMERSFLIKHACRFPQLYDAFFKYLALKIYKVPRDSLENKIAKEYPLINFPVALQTYHLQLKDSFKVFGRSVFIAGNVGSFLLYNSLSAVDFNPVFVSFGAILGAFGWYYGIRSFFLYKFHDFSDLGQNILKGEIEKSRRHK